MKKAIYIVILLCSLQSCTNYYYAYTSLPVDLYTEKKFTSALVYRIPANARVKLKKKKGEFRYVSYSNYQGYAYTTSETFKTTPTLQSYSPAASSTTQSTGGSVNVKGYYRKDGTYVRPHTRKAPTRKH